MNPGRPGPALTGGGNDDLCRCDDCDAALEPIGEADAVLDNPDCSGWQCPNCGPLWLSERGSRCDECGAVEESWGADNLLCPACVLSADTTYWSRSNGSYLKRAGLEMLARIGR